MESGAKDEEAQTQLEQERAHFAESRNGFLVSVLIYLFINLLFCLFFFLSSLILSSSRLVKHSC